MPSSVIYGMRYEPRGRTLDVVFRATGETYRYFDVPREVWRAFLRSSSKGTFLNTTFKDGGYGYRKLEGMAMSAGAAPDEAAEGAFLDVPDENVWGFYE